MSILHITFDYPDQFDNSKTRAVFNLIQCAENQDNIVFSLNRTANPFSNFRIRNHLNCYSCKVYGFPYGIGLYFWMFLAFRKIKNHIKEKKIKIHLIHAHKLSSEGIIANFLSGDINVPYIMTIRGDTDLKLIKYKKLYRRLYGNILKKSKKIIFLAPWTYNYLIKKFKFLDENSKCIINPNIIDLNPLQEEVSKLKFPNKFITVFNLNTYKRKNIKRTIEALNIIHNDYPDISLDIVGAGEKGIEAIKQIISHCKFPDNFTLLGGKSQSEVSKLYQNYLGLILPSFPETFGLVFIEALQSGIPIIYSKYSGIDGYFDQCKIGEKVTHNNIKEIEKAILKIYLNNLHYREEIKIVIDNGELKKFSRINVKNIYLEIINECKQ